MNRPKTISTVAILVGILTVIFTLSISTWIISYQSFITNQITPLPQGQVHVVQGISIVFGVILGSVMASILSPDREIRRSITLGIIIIVLSSLTTIRSYTQTQFDMAHLIIYIFTIPCAWLSAYVVKTIIGGRQTKLKRN